MRQSTITLSTYLRLLAAVWAMVLFASAAMAFDRPYGAQRITFLKDGRPGITAFVNGKGPFLFIVDTASSHTVLTPALQKLLNIQPTNRIAKNVATAAGYLQSFTYPIEELASTGVIVEGIDAIVVDLPDNLQAMGAIGADFLSNFVVDLDFPSQTLRLFPYSARLHTENLHRIRGRLNSHNFIVLPAVIDHIRASAVFDTGAKITVINYPLAVRAGYYESKDVKVQQSIITDAGNQRQFVDSREIRNIEIGKLKWRSRPVLVSDMPVFEKIGLNQVPSVFVGLDLLKGRRIVLEYGTGSIWFPAS
jgi:predicted aspartyl protease